MGTFKQRNPKEVHINIYIWVLKDPQDFLNTWNPPLIADCHQTLKGNVVALRVHNANLIRLRHQTLEKAGSECRFSAPRRSCNENIAAIRWYPDDRLVEMYTESNMTACELVINFSEVV